MAIITLIKTAGTAKNYPVGSIINYDGKEWIVIYSRSPEIIVKSYRWYHRLWKAWKRTDLAN